MRGVVSNVCIPNRSAIAAVMMNVHFPFFFLPRGGTTSGIRSLHHLVPSYGESVGRGSGVGVNDAID